VHFRTDPGQALVVGTTLAVERLGFGQTAASAARAIGLGRPRGPGMAVASGISFLLLLVIPVFVGVTGSSGTLRSDALWLLPGLFAQAGVAEEVLFRGYLYGRLRRGRSFWRAARLSMLPFVAVHLLLFLTMPWSVALAALVLSVVLSFPFARLFELGGNTIWPRPSCTSSCREPSRSLRFPTTRLRGSRSCGWLPARCCPCWHSSVADRAPLQTLLPTPHEASTHLRRSRTRTVSAARRRQ
jgi:hypothetical protein